MNILDDDETYSLTTGITYTTGNTAPVYTFNTAPTNPVYTITTGTNGTGSWNFNNITTPISVNQDINGHTLKVKGDADIEGDLTVNGKSISKSLEAIEEKLAILHPNENLEAKWENLRELRKQYMELEAEILSKEKVWDILKK